MNRVRPSIRGRDSSTKTLAALASGAALILVFTWLQVPSPPHGATGSAAATTSPDTATSSPAAISASPGPGDDIIPEDARKLLAQIPHFDRSETEAKVLGTGTEFAVSADAILHTDFSPSGSLVTVVEASEVGITAYDADLESGVLANLATLDVGTTTPVVTRSITEPLLLIGGDAVVAVRLDEGVQTVLELQELPEDLAGPTTRAPFVWSPSRQAVATMACSSETCVVDLIRVSDLSVSRMEEPFILHALTDSFALGYPSLSDRRWHVIDLSTGQRTRVAPQIAAAYDAFARDDGRFVAYGSTSWEPEIDPVDRHVVVIEPGSGATQLLFDQGPADWRYLYTGWTSTDWILLEEREGPGRTIVDQNDGSAVTFVLDDAGQPIAP